MNLQSIFLNWQSLAIALLIYAMTEGVRRFVQSVWKGWKTSAFYKEFVLWSLPWTLGALLGVSLGNFPWPIELTSRSSRVVYCVVLGLFCAIVYNRVKKFVTSTETPSSKEGG